MDIAIYYAQVRHSPSQIKFGIRAKFVVIEFGCVGNFTKVARVNNVALFFYYTVEQWTDMLHSNISKIKASIGINV